MTRIVLDSRAKAHLLHHLEIVERSLLDPLFLEEAPLAVEEVEPVAQLFANAADRATHLSLRRDVVGPWINRVAVECTLHPAPERVHLFDRLDVVAEELDPDRRVVLVGREDLDDVAPDAKCPAMKIDVVALVLNVDELPQQRVAAELLPHGELHHEPVIALGATDAVDAADARDDDDIAPRQERHRRGMAHPVDLIVDDRVLVDERVGRRDVCLRLVVVVITDEILDGILGEELAHLPVELGRQGLVRREDERGPTILANDVGDRERLARAGDTQQDLIAIAALEPIEELNDRLRLIALGLERRRQPERRLHREATTIAVNTPARKSSSPAAS
jgi:hypothetical protein